MLGGPPVRGSGNQTLPLDTEGWRGEAGEERGTGTQRGGGQFLALGARGLLLGPLPQPMSLRGSLCSGLPPPHLLTPPHPSALSWQLSGAVLPRSHRTPWAHPGSLGRPPTVPPQPCQSRTSRKGQIQLPLPQSPSSLPLQPQS